MSEPAVPAVMDYSAPQPVGQPSHRHGIGSAVPRGPRRLRAVRPDTEVEPPPAEDMADMDVADMDVADMDVADMDVADMDVADMDVAEGPGPDQYPTSEPPDPADLPGPADRSAAVVEWLAAAFAPRSGLWEDRQPSPAEAWRRATHGAQLPGAGPLRTAAKAHGAVAVANQLVCASWVWLVDHPARLAVVTALTGLALAWPPARHLLAELLAPLAWVQHVLDQP